MPEIPDLNLVGPAPAFVHRLRGRYHWQIIVRGSNLSSFLKNISLPQGWTIDIDPVGCRTYYIYRKGELICSPPDKTVPDPFYGKSETGQTIDKSIRKLISDMQETLQTATGVGLAEIRSGRPSA